MNRIVDTLLAALVLAAPGRADIPPGLAWERTTGIAAGSGERGPWQQNASRYDYVDDATVAFDAAGALALAWVDQGRKDVLFQKRAFASGQPGGAPVNVSRSPGTFSWQPRIAMPKAAPRTVYLLWQEIIFSGGSHGGDILFARSTDGGAHFDTPLNLSQSRGGDGKGRLDRSTWSNGSLDLAVGPDGTVLAAWTEYHGALWLARSRDGGLRFAAPQRIAGDDAQPARAPALAAGAGGQVYLAWSVGEGGGGIALARSGDGGASFDAPRTVSSGAGHADAPRLVVDARSALHLVYAHAPAGRGGRYHIRYARSPGGPAPFSAGRTISAVGSGTDSAAYPAIAVDGGNRVYVSWEAMAAGAPRPHALGIAVSGDGGRHFSLPAQVPGSAVGPRAGGGSHQGLLGKKLAADASGRLAIVNSSMLPGERSRVWLMRGRPTP